MGSITRSDLFHGIYGREWFASGSGYSEMPDVLGFELDGHRLMVFKMLTLGY